MGCFDGDSILNRIGDVCLRIRTRKILTTMARLPSSSQVLDCGAGKPFFAGVARRVGLPLTIISLDPDLQALVYEFETTAEHRVAADGFYLPFGSRTFDCVVLSEVLEHVDDPPGLLREVGRVLKRDGLVIATVPCNNYPFIWDPVNKVVETITRRRRHIRSGFWAGTWAGHLRLYSPELLSAHFLQAGFNPIQIERIAGWCLPFNVNLLRIGAVLFYGNRMPQSVGRSFDRFTDRGSPSGISAVILCLIGVLERVNERWPRRRAAVGIYAEARLS